VWGWRQWRLEKEFKQGKWGENSNFEMVAECRLPVPDSVSSIPGAFWKITERMN